MNHHSDVTTTVCPKFDQYHIVLATVKHFQFNNRSTIPTDHSSIILLSQKHIYNGIVFKLYEIYGTENHHLKFSTNNPHERRKNAARKKPLIKAVTTPSIVNNEPLLYTNITNR